MLNRILAHFLHLFSGISNFLLSATKCSTEN